MSCEGVMSIVKAILYWVVSCTWGAVMTFVGAVTSLVLTPFARIPPPLRRWDELRKMYEVRQ